MKPTLILTQLLKTAADAGMGAIAAVKAKGDVDDYRAGQTSTVPGAPALPAPPVMGATPAGRANPAAGDRTALKATAPNRVPTNVGR